MAFHVGQKVEYIGGLNVNGSGLPLPRRGVVYTVSNFYIKSYGWGHHIEVVEILELPFDGNSEFDPGFNARAFRPIVERKTDIGFAHEILRKVNNPAVIDLIFED